MVKEASGILLDSTKTISNPSIVGELDVKVYSAVFAWPLTAKTVFVVYAYVNTFKMTNHHF